MKFNWDVARPYVMTAIGGAFAGMLLLSHVFGFSSPTTTENLARARTEAAVVAALAPVCADKFAALPDTVVRKASLVANKENSWKMRESFPDALVTLPGRTYMDGDLIAACAALVLAPPKAAVLKQ